MSFDLTVKANAFAIEAHQGQRRQGVVGLPYVCHPMEVVNILAGNGYQDDVLLAAAYLHDTVEDTPTTLNDIHAEFGFDVRALVAEVTFPDSFTKEEKVLYAKSFSRAAVALKTADLISNINSLVEDPTAKTEKNAYRYVTYAQAMVEVMQPDVAMQLAFDSALLNFNLYYNV